MSEYLVHGFNLTDSQKKSIAHAVQNKTGICIRLAFNQLKGNDELALTRTQVYRVMNNMENGRGMNLKLSKAQLEQSKKIGGFLPLLLGALSAAGALAGGASAIAKTVHDKQEQERHNRAIEAALKGSGLSKGNFMQCPTCRGSGLYLSKNR
jgi:hypothetical protein